MSKLDTMAKFKPTGIYINDFNALPSSRQCELLQFGVLLGKQIFPKHSIVLYMIHDFFVEVYYESCTDRIIGLDSFRDLGQLCPEWKNDLLKPTDQLFEQQYTQLAG